MFSRRTKTRIIWCFLITSFGFIILLINPVYTANGNSLQTDHFISTQPLSLSSLAVSPPQFMWQPLEFFVVPSPRNGSSFVYNPVNGIALLFGGLGSSGEELNDLWITNGSEWMLFQTPHSPEKRRNASMAYAISQQSAILFGGVNNATLLGDTWLFNGADWVQRQPQTSPSPRANASMAYDRNHDLTILFGGQVDLGNNYLVPSNETWLWDGVNWQKLSSDNSPSPRWGASMVYDSARKSILLFGGVDDGGYYDDTWLWDGVSWIELYPTHHPAGRANFGMALDEARQQIILFGGQSYTFIDTTETWIWDGQDWSKLLTLQSPPEEIGFGAQLAYLPDLKTVMLYNAIHQKSVFGNNSSDFSSIWALEPRYPIYLPMVSK